MTGTKIPFGARISSLAKALIALERKANGGSDGEALERLVYRGSVSDEARTLIVAEASKDPQMAAIIPAIRESPKPGTEQSKLNEEASANALAKEGSSRALRLVQESGKKQTTESPSENKPSRASSDHGNRH